MEIAKIAAIGIITALCVSVLREQKSEIAVILGIVGGCVILIEILDYFFDVVETLKSFSQKAGISSEILSPLLKIVGIGYVADFSAGVVEDMGQKSLADKIIFAGKLIILALSLPIINLLFETVSEVVR